MVLDFSQTVPTFQLEKLEAFLKKRATNYPLAYLIKEQEFYGRSFEVGEGVFIPRPETEILVEKALDFLKTKKEEKILACELGAGTGCISLSLVLEDKRCFFQSVEASSRAFSYLRKNIHKFDLEKQVTAVLEKAEDFAKKQRKFHLVVANPPYLDKKDPHVDFSVRQFEPDQALWAEERGFEFLKRWSTLAVENLLFSGGLLLLETGYDQRPALEKHLSRQKSLSSIEFHKDFSGRQRVATCYKSI